MSFKSNKSFALKYVLLLVAFAAIQPTLLAAQNVAGIWQGTLHDGKDDARLVVKIKETAGRLTGELYDIDEDGDPVALSGVGRAGDTLSFSIALMGINFTGRLSPDLNSVVGTWTADKKPLPLTMMRATAETAWDIPKPTVMMDKKADPAFEVATIKPAKPEETGAGYSLDGRNLSTIGTTLDDLIGYAFDVHRTQVVGAPEWANSTRFDVAGVPDAPGEPSYNQTKSMMRKLLADRFQLKFHTEQKLLPVYILSVAPGGPKHLTKSAGPDNGFSIPIGGARGGLKITVFNGTLTNFAVFGLHGVIDRPVLDKTGLPDRYDFSMTWLPDSSQFDGKADFPAYKNPQPDIYTALREQLGLKLEPTKTNIDVMVIDHAESPSPN